MICGKCKIIPVSLCRKNKKLNKNRTRASVFQFSEDGKQEIYFMWPKYDIGTWLGISRQRQTFSKGFLPNWIEEVFIRRELQREPVYYLCVLEGKA